MKKKSFFASFPSVQSIMLGALLVLLPGCSSTQVQSTRHPAGLSSPPFRTIMVVGMDERPDVRNPFENNVVRYLKERGVAGTASHAQFNIDELKGDKERLRQRFLAAGAESVLFVRVTERADFVEGPPASLGDVDAGAVAESRYNALTTPGGEINTALGLGTRLYRVSDGAVIWSALVREIMKEDADPDAFIRKTAKTIVDRLAKDKVIP